MDHLEDRLVEWVGRNPEAIGVGKLTAMVGLMLENSMLETLLWMTF